MFYAPDGTDVPLFFKLEFPCYNNEGGFEALIIWLVSSLQKGSVNSVCKEIPRHY